jgi:aryl-alcohol dehydrogenase-like predicted oxidoreductase
VDRSRTETLNTTARSFPADCPKTPRAAKVWRRSGIPTDARARRRRQSGNPGVALGWLLSKPVITAPIVGATKLHHLDDTIASVAVKLTAEEIVALKEPYVPHAVVGFV